MVIKGGCKSTCIARTTEFSLIRSAGPNVPAGTLAVVRSLLVLRCSREQNALHTLIHQRHLYAIMRRTRPYRGENSAPGKDVNGELDPTSGIREQARPTETSGAPNGPVLEAGFSPIKALV